MPITKKHILVTIRLSGRTYRLKAKTEDEEYIRGAVKVIERKINQYRNYFSGAESELEELDYVNMTSIQAVAENVSLESKNKVFEDRIRMLTRQLDEYLKE